MDIVLKVLHRKDKTNVKILAIFLIFIYINLILFTHRLISMNVTLRCFYMELLLVCRKLIVFVRTTVELFTKICQK